MDEIKGEIIKLKKGINVRVIVTLIILVLMGYLVMGQSMGLPMPKTFSVTEYPEVSLLGQLCLLLIGIIINHNAISSGIYSLFIGAQDVDSLLVLPVIGSLVQHILLLINPEEYGSGKMASLAFAAITVLFFNLVGKCYMVKRIFKNYRFVSGNFEKRYVHIVADREISNDVCKNLSTVEPFIAVDRKANVNRGFLLNSYAPDIADQGSKITSPVIFILAILLGIATLFVRHDWASAITVFSVLLVIAPPVSATICSNFHIWKAAKCVNRIGGLITGYHACEEIYDANCVYTQGNTIFPKGTVKLSGIKTFAAGRIDEAILDAASVVIKANSPLSDVFLGVIGNRVDLLKNVDTLNYEEGMGLSAWVNSKRVLIGNSLLMKHHGIVVPSKDYENRFFKEGLDIVYLAASGELTAAFLINYTPSLQIKKAMKSLYDTGLALCVSSCDQNITAEKVSQVYSIPSDMIKIVPHLVVKRLDEHLDNDEEMQTQTGIGNIGTFSSFVRTVTTAIKAKERVAVSYAIQKTGIILSVILTLFCILFDSISIFTAVSVLIFQIFWLIAVYLVPCVKKY